MTLTGDPIDPKHAEAAGADADLAYRHAPLLRLDSAEPFRPVAVGYSVFRDPDQSPSSKFAIEPVAETVIEYAVYWDYDIKHVYDLEHVWLHLDASEKVVRVEASQHGRREQMAVDDLEGQICLWVEPGEHAFFADDASLMERSAIACHACGPGAGEGRIHTSNPFGAKAFGNPTPFEHRLARLFLRRHAFEPQFDGDETVDLRESNLLPWSGLADLIPKRMNRIRAGFASSVPHLAAVFLDCGDTLVDEGTEQKDPVTEIVQQADLVAGASDLLGNLEANGYRLALVADGPRKTFENVLGHHRLWPHFEVHITSGDIGELKPSPAMFQAAMDDLGLSPDHAAKVVMVGNNLERDIAGANAFGLISIFFDWSDRRRCVPDSELETPDHTIGSLQELPVLLDSIESAMQAKATKS